MRGDGQLTGELKLPDVAEQQKLSLGDVIYALAALIGTGTLVMIVAGRREDIITTAITTAVVMVVAAMSPHSAWRQPLLRLVDTIVGIAVGIGCMQIASFLLARKRAR
jgi:uncharacterized membrane protein YccC